MVLVLVGSEEQKALGCGWQGAGQWEHQEGSEPWGAARGHGAGGSSPFLAVWLHFGAGGRDAALEAEAVLSWAQCLQFLQFTPWLAPLVQSWQRLHRGRSVVLGLYWVCRDSRDALGAGFFLVLSPMGTRDCASPQTITLLCPCVP